ncbi:hypothetical protein [Cohaesibacter celericrescens]|nr:hypothetical protein [Cohaesibacter celericrescens]
MFKLNIEGLRGVVEHWKDEQYEVALKADIAIKNPIAVSACRF